MPGKSSKRNDLLILFVFVAVLLLAGLAGYYFISNSRNNNKTDGKIDTSSIPVTQQEIVTNLYVPNDFDVETRKIYKGIFEKVEDGTISLRDGDNITDFEVHREVFLVCVEDVEGLSEFDYTSSGFIGFGPNSVGNYINTGEFIAIEVQDLAGVPKAHSVAVSSQSCPE